MSDLDTPRTCSGRNG